VVNHVVKAAIIFFMLWKTVPPVERILAEPDHDDASEDDEDATDLVPLEDAASGHS